MRMLQAVELTIRLHPDDDVVIARIELATGTLVSRENVRTVVTIPAGHKLAVRDVAQGKPVRRYNQIIGFATRDIKAGEHVHVHNLAMGNFERDYAFGSLRKETQYIEPRATFQGIVRADGRVATRNYIGILTSVNCSATVARMVADHFKNRLEKYPNVDGVVALTHKTGCGMASEGEGMEVLRRTMAGYARHPNFFATQVIGLGCEANQINNLLSTQSLKRHERMHAFTIQEKGGTMKAVREGIARIEAILPEANRVKRETVPASHLVLGLQCGGSDGYSGISANPALGAAVDLLVRHGGSAILSETPEIYGAEHLLTARSVTREVGEKLIARIRWWEEHTARNNMEMNNNPTPGNKAGGLTTILEKSLGAVAKGGTTNLVDVVEYAMPVSAKGFVYMDTPGYDPVSATWPVAPT
jgi:altronate hydrolase